MKANVLIVEDEKHLADGLRFNLEAEGYRVETVADGETALAKLTADAATAVAVPFDAVILDVMLPGIDGFTVASELRRAGQFVPVLMLTARGRPEDVLNGFEAGADDYLPKPFELSILLARLSGLLRRREWLHQDRAQTTTNTRLLGVSNDKTHTSGDVALTTDTTAARHATEELFKFDGKTIDFDALELRVGERVVRLTLMEADLLRHLIRHAGRAVSRKSMLEEVWNLREDTDTRAIDNFIVRLRKYIEAEPAKPRHLLTVRGVGYRFIPDPKSDE
ncbi:MAG: two-component system, OmpR family, alkaline phosphatase synthesis response regulator PhoP [Pyrinomonadaceae bacterium]|nr:two-component system, OmpR family, alkaline phosphatase synthesis response regulator PhoP [Pyrinomonadaceae bacterium]